MTFDSTVRALGRAQPAARLASSRAQTRKMPLTRRSVSDSTSTHSLHATCQALLHSPSIPWHVVMRVLDSFIATLLSYLPLRLSLPLAASTSMPLTHCCDRYWLCTPSFRFQLCQCGCLTVAPSTAPLLFIVHHRSSRYQPPRRASSSSSHPLLSRCPPYSCPPSFDCYAAFISMEAVQSSLLS